MLFFDHELEDSVLLRYLFSPIWSVESRQFNQESNFFWIDISKEILKCMYKFKGTRMAQTILKEVSWKAYLLWKHTIKLCWPKVNILHSFLWQKMGLFRILKKLQFGGAVLRWQRNRTERPLSPHNINRKVIWTLSKFHITTSEHWRRAQGIQKRSHSLWKEVGQNIKDKKRQKS